MSHNRTTQPFGSVIEGSLSQGLEVRLHPDVSVEQMRVGKFLVVQGIRSRFFCLLTDVSLGTTNPRILSNPPSFEDSFMHDVLTGSGTYGKVELAPMLMFTPIEKEVQVNAKTKNKNSSLGSFEAKTSSDIELLPVKTIPAHFSQVDEALEKDFRCVFGCKNDPIRRNFAITKYTQYYIELSLYFLTALGKHAKLNL